MFGDIHPLVTLKMGICIELFNPLLHLIGVHVWAIQPLVTLKRGVCVGLFNPLLHV
jgi:hypothetical protein